MSATERSTASPTLARASSTIEAEMSRPVTFQPRSSIGMKLLPVPQADVEQPLPVQAVELELGQEVAQPQLVVVVGGEIVVDRGDRLVGDFRPACPFAPCGFDLHEQQTESAIKTVSAFKFTRSVTGYVSSFDQHSNGASRRERRWLGVG